MINHNAIDRSPKSHTTNNCYMPPHCRTLPDPQGVEEHDQLSFFLSSYVDSGI
ncbi:hypothetical protein T08_3948 [Trichinella sp. T8]|nr:hypothetical protein T08_3948 [Trichinella sp. T8]